MKKETIEQMLLLEYLLDSLGVTTHVEFYAQYGMDRVKVGEIYTNHISEWYPMVSDYIEKYQSKIAVYCDGKLIQVFQNDLVL